MDWFEKLTGFRETTYEETRRRLSISSGELRSEVNGRTYGIGTFEFVSLAELRSRVAALEGTTRQTSVDIVVGDVRKLHAVPEFAGALFQVASQFNCLEMVGPNVTPEDGVGRYEHDHTQGPACAIAAGSATIFRNYFVPVDGEQGQTKERQLDGLKDVGLSLSKTLGVPPTSLWSTRNGYAQCTEQGLAAISRHLSAADDAALDHLRSLIRFGIHWDAEVTDTQGPAKPCVSQIFCSALPVAYSDIPARHWEPFARLVLEAAYEATLLAGCLNAPRTGLRKVLLTSLGGGAFGNDDQWIRDAMVRALRLGAGAGLEVKLVSYGKPSRMLLEIAGRFAR